MSRFDFILDFCQPELIKEQLFSKDSSDSQKPRCTFQDILRFIEDQTCFKHSKQEYKDALTFFMRGYDTKKGAISGVSAKANIEDVCNAMRKYTNMSEQEIKDFERAHDNQLLIDEIENGEDLLKMIDIEESSKLLFKY